MQDEKQQQQTEKRFVGDAFICRRYDVSPQTLWRWRYKQNTGFPLPIKPGDSEYAANKTELAALDAYDAMLAAKRGA